MLDIYIDADGCPVKQETYKVANRYKLKVFVAANAWMETPNNERIRFVLVDDQFDAADDWIVEHVTKNDIVVTADIPLAARCLEKEARPISPRGRIFKEASIGDALANREVSAYLRELGAVTGGPAPFGKKDRSNFLQKLDQVIQKAKKG